MKSRSFFRVIALSVLSIGMTTATMFTGRVSVSEKPVRTIAEAQEAYGRLPLSFELNRGQASEPINFLARGPGYSVALTANEAVFALSNGGPEIAPPKILRMNLLGANREADSAGLDEGEGRVNYLLGNDEAHWRTNIPTFARVRYREVYPGVDLVYYGNQKELEYDFVVSPGTAASAIALEFSGADKVEIESATGDLLLRVGENTLRQRKPSAYQETSAGRRTVETSYAMIEGGRVGFEIGAYDRSAPLIIDPVLVYSTYLGGSAGDQGLAIAVDSSGNAYIAGFTASTNFPTANALQSSNGTGQDAFVTKLNAAGTAFVYSTYLGGSANDQARGIAVNSAANVFVTGFTASTNFPTASPVQAAKGATGEDVFMTKLNAAGNALVYSTYLGGGTNSDFGEAIAVDSAGNAYVTGITFSTDFPVANAIQSTNGGGTTDGFVTKINAAGNALVYSTYLGGSLTDGGDGIAVDSGGNAYVTGDTASTNFPTASPIQATNGSGTSDAFVTKVNAAGTAFVYSTYLGGSGKDDGNAIAVDSAGNAYLTGETDSTNFPVANAVQPANGGTTITQDAFVTKLNAAGNALVYSTYLGGTGGEIGYAIAVDSGSNAYIAGATGSNTNFPTVHALQCSRAGGSDAFLTKLNSLGSGIRYSTYGGGSVNDEARGVAVDSSASVYVAGITRSSNWPVLNPIQSTFGGDTVLGDAFIFKLSNASGATCESAQLVNISTRLRVGNDPNQLIGGFIVTGSEPKRLVVVATGPSLAQFGIQGVLADPILQVFQGNTLIATNDNWKIPNEAEVAATGVPPSNDLESALVGPVNPGSYTANVRGTNGTGVGTVQIYDLATDFNSKLANISARGLVEASDSGFLIGGFIVGGNGTGNARLVVRALGPSLSAFGIAGPLSNPTLELKDANGGTITSNDDWQQSTEAAEINSRGLAPSDLHESALVASLAKGNYTAIVRGVNSGTGVGTVEVYHVD